MKDGLWIIRVVNLTGDTKNVATFSGVVLDVVVCALVCKLSQLALLGGKLLIKVVEVEAGWRQILDARKKHSRLQSRHWSLKLRRDERDWLVLNSKSLVEFDGVWDEVCVELVEVVIKECGEVFR